MESNVLLTQCAWTHISIRLITATRIAKYLVMTARKGTARRIIVAVVVVPKVKDMLYCHFVENHCMYLLFRILIYMDYTRISITYTGSCFRRPT